MKKLLTCLFLLALFSPLLAVTDLVTPDKVAADELKKAPPGPITHARPIILLVQADQPPAKPPETSDSEPASDDDLFAEYDTAGDDIQMVPDPLYHFNYAMYGVNDFLYFYALKPIAQGYSFVVPTLVRRGIGNFFNNLMFPVRFINCALQGKASHAADELSSFLINTTLGIAGINDFAQKHVGLRPHMEDFGQTLATYSIGDGCYLVLPILGPSTLRDAVGRAGDYFVTPTTYATPWELAWGASALDRINQTSFRIGDYEALKEASLDPYVALRNAYIQNRRSLIKQ